MKRIFIAIKIKPGDLLLDTFHTLNDLLRNDRIWWVSLENMHLTLKFIGDLEEERIEVLKNELIKISSVNKFKVQIRGIKIFIKNRKDPRVIFTSVEKSDELYNLVVEIEECLKNAGIQLTEKKFTPHITLGRIKQLNNNSILEGIIEDFGEEIFQDEYCKEFILYESTLTPKGSIYTPLEIYKLK